MAESRAATLQGKNIGRLTRVTVVGEVSARNNRNLCEN